MHAGNLSHMWLWARAVGDPSLTERLTGPCVAWGRAGSWEPAIGEGLRSGPQGLQAAENPCLEISTGGPRAGAGSNRGIITFLLLQGKDIGKEN